MGNVQPVRFEFSTGVYLTVKGFKSTAALRTA